MSLCGKPSLTVLRGRRRTGGFWTFGATRVAHQNNEALLFEGAGKEHERVTMEVRVSELDATSQRIEFVSGTAVVTQMVVNRTSPVEQTVEVTVSADRVAREAAEQLRKLSGKVKIAGFRPGKVPATELQKRYGASARMEALDALLNRTMQEALQQPALREAVHFSEPMFEGQAPTDGAFSYKMIVENFPSVELGEWKGLPVEQLKVVVSDEEVDAEVTKLQQENSTLEPVEDRTEVQAGDVLTVSYIAADPELAKMLGGRDEQVDLAGGSVIPSFAAGVLGLQLGVESTISVDMPENSQSPELAGKTVDILVTVNSIRIRNLPELNDEFAASTDLADNMEGLRTAVHDKLLAEKTRGEEQAAKARLMRTFVESGTFALPSRFVAKQAMAEVEQMFSQYFGKGFDFKKSGIDLRQFTTGVTPRVETSLRSELMLLSVADASQIEVTPADLKEYFEKRAEEEGAPVAKVRARFAKPEQMINLQTRLRLDRALEALWAAANISLVDALTTPDPAEDAEGENLEADGEENESVGE
jgi:trigger factor